MQWRKYESYNVQNGGRDFWIEINFIGIEWRESRNEKYSKLGGICVGVWKRV